MKENFIPISEIHMYNSRSSIGNFHVPSADSFIKKTFYYNAIKDWNSLPIDIRNIKNKNMFKKKLKCYLLEKMKITESVDYVFY